MCSGDKLDKVEFCDHCILGLMEWSLGLLCMFLVGPLSMFIQTYGVLQGWWFMEVVSTFSSKLLMIYLEECGFIPWRISSKHFKRTHLWKISKKQKWKFWGLKMGWNLF